MENKTVMHIAQYAAPYMGNFIGSLVTLENKLKEHNCKMIYVFPIECKKTDWIDDFAKEHIVYFVDSPKYRLKIFLDNNLIKQLKNIIEKEKPDVIHTHFDGYDVPVVKAANKDIKVIWHYHTAREYMKDIVRNTYQRISFYIQYHIYGKSANIISVSKEYIKWIEEQGGWSEKIIAIPNGINENRIEMKDIKENKLNNFLCYGGRWGTKGLDILLEAMDKINKKKIEYTVLLTKGADTVNMLNKMGGGIRTCGLLNKEKISMNF